jgi:hypothetical protein
LQSEIRVTSKHARVYITLGASLTVVTLASMLLFPDIWRVAVYAAIAVAVLTAAGSLSVMAGRTYHELAMLSIARDKARLEARFITVAQTSNLYDAIDGVVSVNAGLLPSGKTEGGEWVTKTQVIDGETNARKLLEVEGIHPVKLKMIADAVLGGAEFTQETAARFRVSRTKFNNWRDNLLRDGYLVPNHPSSRTQGVRLTAAGIAHLQGIGDTPIPRADDN